MNRRGVLKAFGAAAAAAMAVEIDPDRLLWTPGARTIFIPDAPKPKNLITDAEQVAVEYSHLGSIETHAALHGQRVIGTAVGRAEFDADWNLLTVNGRRITSAREAADLQASHYTAHGPCADADLVARVAAEREAAGLKDDVKQVINLRYRADGFMY